MAFTAFTEFIGAFMKDSTDEDPADHIKLFGGTVADGDNLGITDLLIHERQFTPDNLGGDTGLRVFRLVTWPGPGRRHAISGSPSD